MSKIIKENTRNTETISAKKAVVLGTKRKRGPRVIIACACAILIAVGSYIFYSLSEGKKAANTAASVMATNDPVVTYPVSLFSDGNARHFEHTYNDITIRYFVLKSSDGIIRSAFDACDVCWPAGKGYYQESDSMVCSNCGRRFVSTLINEVKGGCNPAPLNRKIRDRQLTIHLEDIVKGKQYFDFSGKV
jgi:uncharacterized membrane protein